MNIDNIIKKCLDKHIQPNILTEYSADQRLPFDDDYFKNKNYLEQYTDWLEDFGKYGELPPSKLDFWNEVKKAINLIKEKKLYDKFNLDLSIYSKDDILNYFIKLFGNNLIITNDKKIYIERAIQLDKSIINYDKSASDNSKSNLLYNSLVDYYQNNVGGCWSFKKGGGKSYCSRVNGSNIILKGYIRIEDIDIVMSLLLNISFQTENEIRVKPNAKVELFEVIADCKYKLPLKGHLIVNSTYFGNNSTYKTNYASIENELDSKKYIDRNGNIYDINDIIKKTFSDYHSLNKLMYDDNIISQMYELNNKFICLEIDNKWTLFNKENNTLLRNGNYWFDEIGDFIDGFVPVRLDNKWSFINNDGELIGNGNAWFDDVTDFSNGYAKVELNYKYSIINNNGELLDNGNGWFDDVILNINNSYGNIIAFVLKNNKWSFICNNGNLVKNGELWFDYLEKSVNNFFYIKLNGKKYIIDTKGNFYDYETKQPITSPIDNNTNENKKYIKNIVKETINQYLYNNLIK